MQEAPPRPPAGPSVACPSCGGPVEPDQLSCLECGAPLRVAHGRMPSWRVTVLGVALALLVLGTGLGFLLRELTTEDPTRAAAPASPAASAPATTAPLPTEGEQPTEPGSGSTTGEPAPDEPLPSDSTESEAPPASDPAPPSAPGAEPPASGNGSPDEPQATSGSVASWPAGKSAFTVILVSSERRVDARREARRASSAGLPAGLLRSNDYSSLRPGYWVAYAGEFEARPEAARRAQSYAAQGFPDAYPRRIEPAA